MSVKQDILIERVLWATIFVLSILYSWKYERLVIVLVVPAIVFLVFPAAAIKTHDAATYGKYALALIIVYSLLKAMLH